MISIRKLMRKIINRLFVLIGYLAFDGKYLDSDFFVSSRLGPKWIIHGIVNQKKYLE